MSPERGDLLFQLYRLSEIERLPIDQIAQQLSLTPYAIRSLRQDPDYRQLRQQQLTESLDAARSRLSSLADMAIDRMVDLAYNAQSGFVQFNAAKQLGDWAGLNQIPDTAEAVDSNELQEFLKQLAQKAQIHIQISPSELPPVREGGLLPDLHHFVDADPQSSDPPISD